MSTRGDGDRTQVTGRPTRTSTPGYGQQLNSRYEVGSCLEQDVFSLTFEGYDTHEEERVVIRVVRPALVPSEEEAESVARRLRDAVGIGGTYLNPLLDAGREGHWAYTVEAPPRGASLRTLFASRLAGANPIQAAELLPVIARIDAGLRALPPPWHHGDIRPERVFFTSDGLKLAGAFLVPALPQKALMQAWSTNPALRERRRADVSRGSSGDATDRYGVGLIAHEAILGRLPAEENPAMPRRLGAIGTSISALLLTDSRRRAVNLSDLITHLAAAASIPIPRLEPGPYRRAKRHSQPRIDLRRRSSVPPAAAEPTDSSPDSGLVLDSLDLEPASSVEALSPEEILDSVESLDLHIAELVSESVELDSTEIEVEAAEQAELSEDATAPRGAIPTTDDTEGEPSTVPSVRDETTRVEPLEISLREAAAIRARQTGLDPRLVRAAMRHKEAADLDEASEETADAAAKTGEFRSKRPTDSEGLDPRLVRAAASDAEPARLHGAQDSGSLDPRLVRAALAMVLDEEDSEEIDESADGEEAAAVAATPKEQPSADPRLVPTSQSPRDMPSLDAEPATLQKTLAVKVNAPSQQANKQRAPALPAEQPRPSRTSSPSLNASVATHTLRPTGKVTRRATISMPIVICLLVVCVCVAAAVVLR